MAYNYTIDFINKEDYDEVIDLLRANFFNDVPIHKCLEIEDTSDFERFAMKMLPLGFSFKAVNTSGKIIGVFVNGNMSKNDEPVKLSKIVKDEKIKVLCEFMEHFYDSFDMYAAYPGCVKVLDACLLSVHESARGLGVATALAQRTLEYGKANNYDLCQCLCNSKFSGLICQKLGFDTAFSVRYDEYLVNSQIIFKPDAPHDVAALYIKRF